MATGRISDPDFLIAPLKNLNQEFLRRCDLQLGEGVVRNFETVRSRIRHLALYLKGRADLKTVNVGMTLAGEPLIGEADNYEVTWKTESPHLPDANGLSHAFDVVVYLDGKPSWSKAAKPVYLAAAEIGLALGLECGAYWAKEDLPHYELKVRVK